MNLITLNKIMILSSTILCLKIFHNYITSNIIKINNTNIDKINNNDVISWYKKFPIYCNDIDSIILCMVNKPILRNLSKVNKYLNNIINDKNFWRMRMEKRLGLKTKNNDINFKLLTNILDNNDCMEKIYLKHKNKNYGDELMNLLCENKKIHYFVKFNNNKNLSLFIDDIYRNLTNQSLFPKSHFKFIADTILLMNNKENIKISELLCITDIINIKVNVNFENDDEIIEIKCNSPLKSIQFLFECSNKLQIKEIRISNNENYSDIINNFMYKIIERLIKYKDLTDPNSRT